jgi:hypothetical protein
MTTEDKQDLEPVSVYSCGPSSSQCKCECATGGACEHVWDGEGVEVEYENGGGWSSVDCSKCGMTAMSHSMWLF